MDGGAWWAIVHGVTKSRTQLTNFTIFGQFSLQQPEGACEHPRQVSSRLYLQHSMAPTSFRVKAKVLPVAHTALSHLILFSFLSLSPINRPLISLCSTHTGLLKILQTCQAHFLLWSLELNVFKCHECFCPNTHIDNSLTSFKSLFQSFLFNSLSSDNSILCSFLFTHPGIHASPTPLS